MAARERTWGRLALLGAVLVLVATACASAPPTRLTEADDGRRVPLAVGDALEVVLDGNPTTGYTWRVEQLQAAIAVQEGQPEYTRDSDALGAGGTYTWRFTTVGPGTTRLRLAYARPWESVPPEGVFEVTLVVR